MRKLLMGLVLLSSVGLATAALAADPTLDQVYQAANAGRLKEAEGMMSQVLRNHPDSAKAHFVNAEILAKDGRYGDARSELAAARAINPRLDFAKPSSVSELDNLLGRATGGAGTSSIVPYTGGGVAVTPASRFPWGGLIGAAVLALLVFAIVRAFRNRNAPQVYPAGYGAGPYNNGPYGNAYPPGYPPPYGPAGGGIGSGILGGLATGAALGAGMVAGEALAHRLEGDGNSGERVVEHDYQPAPDTSSYDMGGNDFGVSDGGWDGGGDSGGGDWT